MISANALKSGEVQNFVGIHPTRKENGEKQGRSVHEIACNKVSVNTV